MNSSDLFSPLVCQPVAYFQSLKKFPQDAARQASIDAGNEVGEIRFENSFARALDDIETFSHLWVIYQFHLNTTWKSKVLPPRFSDQKRGVFSTRSPYRPNPIGLSAVELVERKGLSLFVRKFDLIDGTPILDVKPYLAYADSIPLASSGWMDLENQFIYKIIWSERASQQLQFLEEHGVSGLRPFSENQLSCEPLNQQKKRLQDIKESKATLCYRTWRIQFEIELENVRIFSISSGYSPEDLLSPEDPYLDKELHRLFAEWSLASHL